LPTHIKKKADDKKRMAQDLKSLKNRRHSPSVQVKPFSLHENDSNLAGKENVQYLDQQNILNELNVSGFDRDDVKEFYSENTVPFNYAHSGNVNDEVIEDIQKRLQLLDEFK
jgi:hypothetical protein